MGPVVGAGLNVPRFFECFLRESLPEWECLRSTSSPSTSAAAPSAKNNVKKVTHKPLKPLILILIFHEGARYVALNHGLASPSFFEIL